MTYGVKGLRRIQIGKSTAGENVAATTYLRGEAVPTDELVENFPVEDVGIAGGVDRSYISALGAMLSFKAPATFEQLGYILNMGVEGVAGVQDGTGSDYVYTRTFFTTAQKTPYFYTVEGGNNAEEEELDFAHVTDFVIEGKSREALTITATIRGQKVNVVSFTGALSIPAVEEILFSKGKAYIDAVSGTIGTTQITGTIIGIKITVNTGFQGVPPFDGNLYYSAVKQAALKITVELTWEHEANAVAQKAAWRAQTPKQMRFIWTGNSVTTSGSAYSNKTFILDVAGKWSKFGPLVDNAGDDNVVGTFEVRYNSTAALYAKTVLVNELSALP